MNPAPEAAVGDGNRVSTMLVPLPTHLDDPLARLEFAHAALSSAKERHKALPASVLQDANHFIPPALFARAARVTMAVARHHPSEAPATTAISNVPGSPTPLFLAGATVEAIHPVSAILDGMGLNMTVMSYCGGLDFGLVCDRGLMGDAWPMAEAIEHAQAELLALVVDGKGVARRQKAAARSEHSDESATSVRA